MKIIFVRHGETDYNIEHRLQGRRDIPLNKNGKNQAKELQELLANYKIDIILSSPLGRAYKTAEKINSKRNLPLIIEPQLIERDFGEFEGKTFDEIRECGIEPWTYSPKTIPSVESDDMLYERFKEFLQEAQEKYKNKSVLIIAHAGLWRCFDWYFNGFPKPNEPLRPIGKIMEYDLKEKTINKKQVR